MNTFWLKVIAADGIFYEGRCESAIIPAIDGSKGILAHHEDMTIAVVDGEAEFQTEDGHRQQLVVGMGFVQIMNNRVTLLVETAEKPEDIDIRRAKEAEERAMERLRQKQSIQEYHLTQAALSRAMSRLKASSKYR